MRKWVLLLVAGVMTVAGTANAGLNQENLTTLTVGIGALAPITINAQDNGGIGNAFLTDNMNGHVVTDTKTLWSTVDLGPGTSLFTGVPLITDLRVTVRNQAGIFFENFNPDGITANGGPEGIHYMCDPNVQPCMGGLERLTGQAVVYALGGAAQLPIALNAIGFANGAMNGGDLIENLITYTGGPWTTGWVQITNITSNIITVPALGNVQGVALTLGIDPDMTTAMNVTSGGVNVETHTVTLHGTNSLLSASKPGQVTLVSPLRIDTGAIAGLLPGKVEKTFNFVPEPGTLLLFVSGAVGLVAVGRRRMRK
jgi:hypothetical protein